MHNVSYKTQTTAEFASAIKLQATRSQKKRCNCCRLTFHAQVDAEEDFVAFAHCLVDVRGARYVPGGSEIVAEFVVLDEVR